MIIDQEKLKTSCPYCLSQYLTIDFNRHKIPEQYCLQCGSIVVSDCEKKSFKKQKGQISVERFNSKYIGALNYIYIGRAWNRGKHNLSQSPLANPFYVSRDGSNRDEAIEKYRRWLWEEVKKGMKGEKSEAWNTLMAMVDYCKSRESDLVLVCWCKPKPCHGDVIKRCIEWLISQGY